MLLSFLQRQIMAYIFKRENSNVYEKTLNTEPNAQNNETEGKIMLLLLESETHNYLN